MQTVPAILIVMYIAMLNSFLNKIFNGFQIRTKTQKNFKHYWNQGKIMKFCLEIREKLWNFRIRNLWQPVFWWSIIIIFGSVSNYIFRYFSKIVFSVCERVKTDYHKNDESFVRVEARLTALSTANAGALVVKYSFNSRRAQL